MDDFERAQETYDRQAFRYAEQANADKKLLSIRQLVYALSSPVEQKRVVVIFEVIPSQQWAIIRYYIGV